MFVEGGIFINTLEYFAAVYCVMLWGDRLRGQVVYLECDNTSAVLWLSKGRATAGGVITDSICKIFSLFCHAYDIVVLSNHLKGELNTVADFRSRSLDLLGQAADEDTVHGMKSEPLSRREICRNILMMSLLQPDGLRCQEIASLLTILRSRDGESSVR